jgi:hypothetical protein
MATFLSKMLHRSSHAVRFGGGQVYFVHPAVPKQPPVWRPLLPVAVLAVAGIPATILMPINIVPLFMPVVIVAWRGSGTIPVTLGAVSVILAASGQG